MSDQRWRSHSSAVPVGVRMETQTVGLLDVVRLTPLVAKTDGRPEIVIGLIDGPVFLTHPDLTGQNIQEVPGRLRGTCAHANSVACLHGTFVAGILCGRRGSAAPAICPGCTLLVRPIYPETGPAVSDLPSATPDELAEAIVDCIDGGARILNLSLVLTKTSAAGSRNLEQALDYAMSRGVLAVAAAGNQGLVGDSVITRHPAVIPVTGSDLRGQPLSESNLGRSIGRRGLMAPGVGVTSLGTDGGAQVSGGTSVAAPFVTGTIALLWSEFPRADTAHIRLAVLQAWSARRRTIAPPLLDAWAAYQTLNSTGT
jgi:subtilisin family serine protease